MKAYIEPEEVTRMESEASNLRDRLLIRLLFRLGCRISEALALKVEDIDFEQGTVTIEHLKARVELCCPKCGARLGKSHKFCPICGYSVEKAVAQEKEHLGHQSFNTTARYRKVAGDEHREWYQSLWGSEKS
jgi:integrase/recombinase XerD